LKEVWLPATVGHGWGRQVKPLVLCADDYALSPGVSRGILELAERGRVSATSAMTNMPAWPRLAPDLRPLAERIGIGLHVNFTTGSSLGPLPSLAPAGSFPMLTDLLQRAFAGRLAAAEVRAEIERQLDAFEQALGAAPSFVDGHQHVHVLPVIRSALLDVLQARGLTGRIWIRDPSDGILPILRRGVSAGKALLVRALATGFRDAARNAGFDTNDGFSGFSPFDPAVSPERVFRRALAELGPRPVVMAHPGCDEEAAGPLGSEGATRRQEFAYLGSSAFADLLRERELRLSPRPSRTPPS
jgi:predicted glycoside hydrolase/deacetylase ChbG (UPF0249 family)